MPSEANIHVVVLALHTSGEYLLGKRLDKTIEESGKSVKLHYWRALTIENRKYYRNNSGVLWPIEIPEDEATKEYRLIAPQISNWGVSRGWWKARSVFFSEGGRQLLEREFFIAGVKIRES